MNGLFLFAYPHRIFFNRPFQWKEEEIEALNSAISIRYREEGWKVGFVIYNNMMLDNRVDCRGDDLMISDGQDVYHDAAHGEIRRLNDGELAWPDFGSIARKIPSAGKLRVGGFHSSSCVEKIAERAYLLGHDVQVDEALTDFFIHENVKSSFNAREFPGYDRLRVFQGAGSSLLGCFLENIQYCPWLYNWRNHPGCAEMLAAGGLD